MRIAERVLIDVDRCIECKACFAACYYGHRYEPIVTYGITGQVQFPLICRQCDEPTCVEACPYSAMCRDEHGIVRRSSQQNGGNSCARRGCGVSFFAFARPSPTRCRFAPSAETKQSVASSAYA